MAGKPKRLYKVRLFEAMYDDSGFEIVRSLVCERKTMAVSERHAENNVRFTSGYPYNGRPRDDTSAYSHRIEAEVVLVG